MLHVRVRAPRPPVEDEDERCSLSLNPLASGHRHVLWASPTNLTTPDFAEAATETKKWSLHSISLSKDLALVAALLFTEAAATVLGARCSTAGPQSARPILLSLILGIGLGYTAFETGSLSWRL